eukprot:CAMPEP_0119014824 /NCGR_PEP_ID=MMETSP1176-20130426/10409_1 /TAXON_ID=265551 /ORGANISM="Synedropsis recta cf, Strain CCMP1620" /LENGTH=336 /DNA_ID=CAMNT_0006968069 /DNA_START=96 /DNA_END=1102 /DNA_ORIENTATION=-
MNPSTAEYSGATEIDERSLQDVELNEAPKADTITDESAMEDTTTTATFSAETGELELTEEELKTRRSSRNKKILIGLLLLASVVFIIVDSLTTGYVRTGIDAFLAWIEANPAPGFFVFMVVYFVATILFIPGSILTLGAGFVFANAFGLGVGILLGTLSVFFGASSGAIVAFLLGRFLLRDWVKTLTKKYAIFEALDTALDQKGFRIMALLRLSPIIPFNAINYIAAVTAVSFRDYCLSLIAILPGTTLFVFLGASAGSLTDSASSGDNMTVTIVVVVVGAIFGIGAIILTSYYAKKELNRVIAERDAAAAALEAENDDEVDVEAQQEGNDDSEPL